MISKRTKRRTVLATAAAALLTTGLAGSAQADSHEGDAAKVKCVGANACKGQTACKTPHNDCSGHNSCKGKGWVYLTDAECKAAKKAMMEDEG